MQQGMFLSWLDSHSGAVTALATIALLGITAVYVGVTYLLVREQRRQASRPEIAFELAQPDRANADLRVANIGSGSALEITILAGPGEGVPVQMPALGRRQSLLPGEEAVWKVRPLAGADGFPHGDLPLTIVCFNDDRSVAYFYVALLSFVTGEKHWSIDNRGAIPTWWDKRRLRRLTRRSLPVHRRLFFQWRTRSMATSRLLLTDDVRNALRDALTRLVEELPSWNDQMKAYRFKV